MRLIGFTAIHKRVIMLNLKIHVERYKQIKHFKRGDQD